MFLNKHMPIMLSLFTKPIKIPWQTVSREFIQPVIVASAWGLGFGILFCIWSAFSRVPAMYFVYRTGPIDLTVSEKIWAYIHTPAIYCWRLWVEDFRLPPQNEVGVWFLVPMASILLQWTLVGFLTGCLCRIFSLIVRRHRPKL